MVLKIRQTDIQNKYSIPTGMPKTWEYIYKSSFGTVSSIKKSDIDTLLPSKDLNGSIINFYMEILLNEIVHPKTFTFTHYFNTYFFSMLVNEILTTSGSSDKLPKVS